MSEAAVGVLWGACGVSRWDRESNEDTYGRFGVSEATVGVLWGACGVSRWEREREEERESFFFGVL